MDKTYSLFFFSRSSHTVYAKSMNDLIDSLCSILQSHPMLLIYLNDYTTENHASPPAYLFFLKLFSVLGYPMLTFHFFHPFHPAVSLKELLLQEIFFRSLEFSQFEFLSISTDLSGRSSCVDLTNGTI